MDLVFVFLFLFFIFLFVFGLMDLGHVFLAMFIDYNLFGLFYKRKSFLKHFLPQTLKIRPPQKKGKLKAQNT
jgi:hypothetical protein